MSDTVNLYMGCPCCDNSSATYWKHVPCGNSTTVNVNGQIGCRGHGGGCCNRQFKDCKWGCYKHDYKYANSADFRVSMSEALAAMTEGVYDGTFDRNSMRVIAKGLRAISRTLR